MSSDVTDNSLLDRSVVLSSQQPVLVQLTPVKAAAVQSRQKYSASYRIKQYHVYNSMYLVVHLKLVVAGKASTWRVLGMVSCMCKMTCSNRP